MSKQQSGKSGRPLTRSMRRRMAQQAKASHRAKNPTRINGAVSQRPPGLLVQLDAEEMWLPAEDLSFEATVQLIAEQASSASTLSVETHDLLAWSPQACWNLFRLLFAMNGPRPATDDGTWDDPLEAILSDIEGKESERYNRGLNAAVEAAALFHPDDPMGASQRIARRLQELGVRDAPFNDVLCYVSELRTSLDRDLAALGYEGTQQQ